MAENKSRSGISEKDLSELQKYGDDKYSSENYSTTISEVPSLIQRGAVYLIALALVITIAILYFGKVDRIVSAKGKIVTEEGDYAIKSFEGGIVRDVIAKEGDELKKGDPILVIEPGEDIKSNMEIIKEKIAVSQREKSLLEEQLKRDEKELENKKKRFEDFSSLYKKGLISKIEFDNERERMWNAGFSIQNEKKQIKSQGIQILTQQMSLKAMSEKNKYTRILMPVNGKVIKMNIQHPGQSILSNYNIAIVRPDNSPIVIEAQIKNKDIAFIKEGQIVQIKVDAFPYQQFGTIKGKVKSILPDVTADANFKITIELLKNYFDVKGKEMKVFAGLTVNAEIVTGKIRLMNMILSSGSKNKKNAG